MFKVLSVLLLIQVPNAQWCLSQDVIRGERDQFRSDVWQTGMDGFHSCADDGNCRCGDDNDGDEGYYNKTFIYEINNLSSGRCVKEDYFVKDTPGICLLRIWPYLSPAQTTKFSLTSFICSCVRHKLTSFSLTRSLVQKLAWPAFEQGSLSRKNLSIYVVHTSK